MPLFVWKGKRKEGREGRREERKERRRGRKKDKREGKEGGKKLYAHLCFYGCELATWRLDRALYSWRWGGERSPPLYLHPPIILFFHNCIYLYFSGCAGLPCCVGSSLLAVCGFLTVLASPVAERRLGDVRAFVAVAHELSGCGSRALEHRLSSRGARAWLLHGMRDPPRPGIETVSPALAAGLPTTEPPGKPLSFYF